MSEFTEYGGKSEVNIRRLVRNIADQYPFEPQKAAIIELIANALDAKASIIKIDLDKQRDILRVEDNGRGMTRKEFKEYHNFASSTKRRGEGIGFAGQGAKLALNFCKKVVTETRTANGESHYSEWFLKGDEAPYNLYPRLIEPLNYGSGTRITFFLDEQSTKFYSEYLIEQVIMEHYFPLVEVELSSKYYYVMYKDGVKIFVNGRQVELDVFSEIRDDLEEIPIYIGRKPKAIFVVGKLPKSSELAGIMICTYGKVIERTYFKKEPKEKESIIGWIEAPYLIEAVTTDKCRFQAGNKTWEQFFKKAQREFSNWLEKKGLIEKRELKRDPNLSWLEREINPILNELFPNLFTFGNKTQREYLAPDERGWETVEADQKAATMDDFEGESLKEQTKPWDLETELGKMLEQQPDEGNVPAIPKRRYSKGGIRITEDEREDIEQEAWFDGETVTINKAHPAYKKSKEQNLSAYHMIKCIAMEVARYFLERQESPSYKDVFDLQQKFFRLWGER